MTREDPGDPTCPGCGGVEWQRGVEHVVIAPITGEAVSFRDASMPRGTWTCHRCGYALGESAVATDLLEAVARSWPDVNAD